MVIAVLIRFAGNRLVPVIMPVGWKKTIAAGWVGGLIGSLSWQFDPQVAGVNIVMAFIGSGLGVIFLGLFPFIKILLTKPP